jgi:DNA-nicking Smr family endonuclease
MTDMSKSDEENTLFRTAMHDVEPIKVEEKVVLTPPRPADVTVEQRRQAAVAEGRQDANFLSGEYVPPVEPLEILEYKRAGVQHGVYRNLRLGKYRIDARLDLHQMTVETARRALFQFIRDCMANDIRCALITHGKGEGREQPALLKSCVAHWLPQFEEVLAFHSAQRQHGASGATYVLLRKSERMRLENCERQHKRR